MLLSPVGVDGDDSEETVRPPRRALSGPLGFDRKMGKDHMLPQEDATRDMVEPLTLFLARLEYEDEDEALGIVGCAIASFLLDWNRRMSTERAVSITDTFNRWFLRRWL
jgi:hypothetical protein